MRRLVPAFPLVVAACAAPPPQATVVPTPPPIIIPAEKGDLIGDTYPMLLSRLGNPVLTVREGDSVKYQWRAASCVLDAYLYGENGAAPRVRHVDARTRSGVDLPASACLSVLSRR